MHTVGGRSTYDPCSPFFASRPEQLLRGIGKKIPFHHKLANLPLSVIARNHLPVDRIQLVDLNFIGCSRIAAALGKR